MDSVAELPTPSYLQAAERAPKGLQKVRGAGVSRTTQLTRNKRATTRAVAHEAMARATEKNNELQRWTPQARILPAERRGFYSVREADQMVALYFDNVARDGGIGALRYNLNCAVGGNFIAGVSCFAQRRMELLTLKAEEAHVIAVLCFSFGFRHLPDFRPYEGVDSGNRSLCLRRWRQDDINDGAPTFVRNCFALAADTLRRDVPYSSVRPRALNPAGFTPSAQSSPQISGEPTSASHGELTSGVGTSNTSQHSDDATKSSPSSGSGPASSMIADTVYSSSDKRGQGSPSSDSARYYAPMPKENEDIDALQRLEAQRAREAEAMTRRALATLQNENDKSLFNSLSTN